MEASLKTGFFDLPLDPRQSRIDKSREWILYIWMVGMLQLHSYECVSEVPSMREREVTNLGSDGVLVLLIRLVLANLYRWSLGFGNSEIHKLSISGMSPTYLVRLNAAPYRQLLTFVPGLELAHAPGMRPSMNLVCVIHHILS
jgi:hypothetical protein